MTKPSRSRVARAARRLLRPQGPDRIDGRRSSSWQERRERGEDEHDERNTHKRSGVDRRDLEEQRRQAATRGKRKRGPDRAPNRGECEALSNDEAQAC